MAGRLVFETPMGFVALAWSEAGLTRLALPQRDREASEQIAAKWPDNTPMACENDGPDFVHDAIGLVRRYACGEIVDFGTLPLDLSGADPFHRAIYSAALKLRQGEVTTYGALAREAGFSAMARETGQALGRNPLPLVIPCHRILSANGIGGFSAPGGAATKQRMLKHEGVEIAPPPAQASFAF